LDKDVQSILNFVVEYGTLEKAGISKVEKNII